MTRTSIIFRVKTLTAHHARVMQDAIDKVQSNAHTRLLGPSTGEALLRAAREVLRERNRYADAVAYGGRNGSMPSRSGIEVSADGGSVSRSYSWRGESTHARLLRIRNKDTGEETWEFYACRVTANAVAYGVSSQIVASLNVPVGCADDKARARDVRARLEKRGWTAVNAEMRKYF